MSGPDDVWNFRFIEEVEKYPILWKSNREGFDESITQEMWSDIAFKFGLNVSACTIKWEKLCQLLQQKMKMNLFELGKWDYYHKLSFLIEDKLKNVNIDKAKEDENVDSKMKNNENVKYPNDSTVKAETETNIHDEIGNSGEISNQEVLDNIRRHIDIENPDLNIQVLNAAKLFPILWNRETQDPLNKEQMVQMAQIWSNIGSVMHESDEDPKRRWNLLRERFRYRIKRYCHNEISYEELSQWEYFPAAEYLIEPIKKGSNLTSKNNYDVHSEQYKRKRKWSSRVLKCDVSTDEKPPSPFDQDTFENEECKLPKLHKNNKKKVDDDYLFLLSLIPKMQKLSEIEILDLRIKIQTAVYEEILSPTPNE